MTYPFIIQFDGLCCHADYNGKKRVLMPDASAVADGEHRVYIEFFEDDFDSSDFTPTSGYSRDGFRYARIELKSVGIKLLNVASSVLTPSSNYSYRVPRLQDVSSDYGPINPIFVQATPDKSIGGYYDIPGGVLTTGPAEQLRTWFEENGQPTGWAKRCVPQWVQLELELSSDTPVLEITDIASSTTKKLTLKTQAGTITIGNQTKLDILGIPYQGGHFHKFYTLAQTDPTHKPMPKQGMGLGTGCSNTNFP